MFSASIFWWALHRHTCVHICKAELAGEYTNSSRLFTPQYTVVQTIGHKNSFLVSTTACFFTFVLSSWRQETYRWVSWEFSAVFLVSGVVSDINISLCAINICSLCMVRHINTCSLCMVRHINIEVFMGSLLFELWLLLIHRHNVFNSQSASHDNDTLGHFEAG